MGEMMKKLGRGLLALVFWLAVWEVSYRAVGKDLLLASPAQVAAYLAGHLDGRFWHSVWMTLFRTGAAYAIGVAAGCLLAGLCHASRLLDALLRPALTLVRATPVASFIILALVWLSATGVPIFAGALMVTPVVYASVRAALEGRDPQLLEMAKLFGWGRLRTFRHVTMRSVLPGFLSACEACVGMCFKATIAAEVIGVPKGAVGTQLYNAKIYLETDGLMAWTLVVIVMSLVTEKLLRWAFERGKERAAHT